MGSSPFIRTTKNGFFAKTAKNPFFVSRKGTSLSVFIQFVFQSFDIKGVFPYNKGVKSFLPRSVER